MAKALARAGVASRRDVERYIAAGRVALNGRTLDTPAVKVEPGDVLTVDGRVVDAPEPTRVWRHHKPAGLLTSHGDPQGRPTVFEHLPEDLPRVISVGRLDIASEGLLLLTNDGELARRLELPDDAWRRTYRVRAHGRADQVRLDTLQAGVTVEGVRYGPIEARLDKATGKGAVGRGRVSDAPANLWITVTVAEGKNREVRRVLEHLGLKVNRLIRVSYGPFALGDLQTGEVEEVSPRVLREQLAGLVAPDSLPKGDRRPGPPVRGAPFTPAVAPRPVAPARPARPPRPESIDPAPRGRAATPAARGAKSGPRPAGAVGRVSGAWTPPAERKPRGAPGGKPRFVEGGKGADGSARPYRDAPRSGGSAVRGDDATRPYARPSGPREKPNARSEGGPARGPKPFGRPAAAPPRGPKPSTGPGPRPAGSKPAGSKPAGRGPAPAGRGGKPAAASRDEPAKSSGMELTPTMRRGPRRKPTDKGPRRPPRGS